MTAWCQSCSRKVQVKKLKGKAPCCGYYNTLVKLPRVREKKIKEK